MKKTLLFTLMFSLLAGCSMFGKDKAEEEKATQEAAAAEAQQQQVDETAVDLSKAEGQPNIVQANIPDAVAKQLKLKNKSVPAVIAPRDANGVNATIKMMSVAGRAQIGKENPELGKILSKKQQVFALAADNNNPVAALNIAVEALKNCPKDSNAAILLNFPKEAQLSEEIAQLEKKCNTKLVY
ncbi:MAG: hypothetical protein J6M05_03775 [Cardiobacteriaceae bacterium]|nr:hypothetical protein [Cardiobacteriaceae bacterium]